MENQTELNEIESEEIAEQQPLPWENAPEDIYYYSHINDDGVIFGITESAELAYSLGYFDNQISKDDVEVSDVNNWHYLKSKCPHKTQEDKFNEAKQNKLSELKKTADSALNGAYVVSSLGFKADANPAAVRDLEGLVIIGADSVMFCDYENNFHPLNKEQVLTLQREILLNGQNLYAQKWTYRAAVNAAETVDELNAITFKFDMLDFSE